MESMRNEYPCGAGSVVKEHIVEDSLPNMSIESRERILDADWSRSLQSKSIGNSHQI
jgi:hypothetical protein